MNVQVRFISLITSQSFTWTAVDKLNDENVLPLQFRLDFPQGDNHPPPTVTVKAQDRSLALTSHSIDILSQTLEEIHTDEEKSLRQSRPKKLVPIDVSLKNIHLCLEVSRKHRFSDR